MLNIGVPTESDNKRQQKREKLIYYLRVFNSENNQYLGRVIDMSGQGVMLIMDNSCPNDSVFDVSVELPEDFSASSINLSIQSMWCNPDVNKDYYIAGFRMTFTNEEDAGKIETLLQNYAFSMTAEDVSS